jgi:hypothetical protein
MVPIGDTDGQCQMYALVAALGHRYRNLLNRAGFQEGKILMPKVTSAGTAGQLTAVLIGRLLTGKQQLAVLMRVRGLSPKLRRSRNSTRQVRRPHVATGGEVIAVEGGRRGELRGTRRRTPCSVLHGESFHAV